MMLSRSARDVGLYRMRRATRLLAVGAIVGGGALSALVARALPGKSAHTASVSVPSAGFETVPRTAASTLPVSSTQPTSTTPTTQPVITPPTQAPQPVVAPPVVNSGGS
jgi:hypothetical protein